MNSELPNMGNSMIITNKFTTSSSLSFFLFDDPTFKSISRLSIKATIALTNGPVKKIVDKILYTYSNHSPSKVLTGSLKSCE